MGKGIVKRWVFNYLSITVLCLAVIVFAASFGVRKHYYDGVREHLTELGNEAQHSFLECGSDSGAAWASEYLGDIAQRESIDVAASDENGQIVRIIPSGSFAEYIAGGADTDARETADSGTFKTVDLPTGERAISYDVTIKDKNGEFAAALRFFEALSEADGKVMRAILFLAAGMVVLLALFVIPTLMYLGTIVKPVREIRATAHRIAQGDYETKVERLHDDEIGELADSINHMAEEIKASDSMKNDFISSVSHELRTPLTAIKGWAETMSLGEPDPATLGKGLGIIINESERLTGMVEELLDFSRMQSGRMVLVMDKCDLLAELGEAVYMLKERAAKENKHFVYEEPESMPPVLADKNRLRQVFINIIDNALKYTPEGGVIGIDVKHEDDRIKVIISDTGCGINEVDLPRIKEKFYKANKTVRGSGIGLAVADDIMQRHKGRLDIESREDVGTTVTITIPVLDHDDEKILNS